MNLANVLRDYDILIFASLQEACSSTIFEALHCGLPAVVRDASINEEVLNNNGIVFNENNVLEKIDDLRQKFNK